VYIRFGPLSGFRNFLGGTIQHLVVIPFHPNANPHALVHETAFIPANAICKP
jgi:hypothetical protein